MYSLGIDVGSVSTDLVLLDSDYHVIEKRYLKTKGQPIETVREGIAQLMPKMDKHGTIAVGTTGSGRGIAGMITGADMIKNEITAHAVAAIHLYEGVSTIIEIGGQDSKIILIRNGAVVDFAMNSVCAAGTGSFLDRQAERLDIPIEQFGEYALRAVSSIRIAGRCAVFAESDMIHKAQLGYPKEEIIRGLCDALARNYLSNVAKGKEIKGKILFQGGVAANVGIKAAFERLLEQQLTVPEQYDMMGAIGAAIMASEHVRRTGVSKFKGIGFLQSKIEMKCFSCSSCSNGCEILQLKQGEEACAYFGDQCGKYSQKLVV